MQKSLLRVNNQLASARMRKRTRKVVLGHVPSKPNSVKAKRAVAGLLKASKGARLRGLKIKDLINEGRE